MRLSSLRDRLPNGTRVYRRDRGPGTVEGAAEFPAGLVLYVLWDAGTRGSDDTWTAWREGITVSSLAWSR